MNDVLVVGAGLAGLACARDLRRAGWSVLVLDKSRGVSGRAATRRLTSGARVDHGARYFTARGERLSALVEAWTREGRVREWTRGFPRWRDGRVEERAPGHPRFVATPGMNALGAHLARPLDVATGAQVTSLARTSGGWRVQTDDGRAHEGRHLLLNLPAPQLAALLAEGDVGEARAALREVRFDPAWTLMLELERDLPVPWKALEVEHPVLEWISREHTKREGLDGPNPPTLVAHATGAWSREHLEDERADVQAALLAALGEVVGPGVAAVEAQVHRWRFATPTSFFGRPHFYDPELRLGWCGDWCAAARVEGALESGWSLAAALGAPEPEEAPAREARTGG